MTPVSIAADVSNDVVATRNPGEESSASLSELAKLSLKDGTVVAVAPSVTANADGSDDNRDDDISVTEKKECDPDDNDIANDSDASTSSPPPANTKTLRRMSSSFIRAHDLEIPKELQQGGQNVSSTRLHESMRAQGGFRGPPQTATEGLFFLDHDLKLILDSLTTLAFEEATDESSRFTPGRETAKVLRERAVGGQPVSVDPAWPIHPWHAANPRNIHEILVWNGMVQAHKNQGFGHDWPIVKARGIIPTSPRKLAEFLWNSDNVSKYNTMSQGREDGTVFQEGFDTRAEDSPYGIPGCAKILKSYNKVKMVPRTIEIISILHARPLEPPLAPKGTYLMVSRSLWEDDDLSGEAAANFAPPPSVASTSSNNISSNPLTASNNPKIVRTEMFLSVQLLRPLGENGKYCEMTTIAHALAPGLNKTVAKTAANVSAVKILRDLQALLRP